MCYLGNTCISLQDIQLLLSRKNKIKFTQKTSVARNTPSKMGVLTTPIFRWVVRSSRSLADGFTMAKAIFKLNYIPNRRYNIMGKLKTKIAKFIADKFFKKEVKEIKDRYYDDERAKVFREIEELENGLKDIQVEYRALQREKFTESVNADLKENTQENNMEQAKQNNKIKDPFADWGV